MDAPSWTPDWEPFCAQPIMEEAFVSSQDVFWASEEGLAPDPARSLEPSPHTDYYPCYGQVQPAYPNPANYGVFGYAQNGLSENEPCDLNGIITHSHDDLNQTNSVKPASLCGEIMPDDVPDLTQAYNPQKLADLPESQLEAIAQNVAKALETRKQKKLKNSVEVVTEHPPQDTFKETRHQADQISKSNTSRFECEHPGCTVTFRRKKDRTRHFRHKHGTHSGFQCPIVDCPLGSGHEVSRSDKLRDHLKSNSASSRIWKCVLPGCLETAVGRDALVRHTWRHGRAARRDNERLLTAYGLHDPQPTGYSVMKYICGKGGCPFGSDSSDVIKYHQMIPHNGLTCPCPIPDCQVMSKDWDETSAHLTKDHSYSARLLHTASIGDQGFKGNCSILSCPVCHDTCVVGYAYLDATRRHFSSHSFAELLAKAQAIVEAYRFSMGRSRIWIPGKREYSIYEPSNSCIFACLAFPDADWTDIRNISDIDRLCSGRGIGGL